MRFPTNTSCSSTHKFYISTDLDNMATEQTQPTWAELLGSNEWNGLLDPLDLSLRKLILSRGDMSQATYDAFIRDPNSKYCGYGRYGRKSFFHKVFLPCASDYQLISFLYATASIDDDFFDDAIVRPRCPAVPLQRQSNWIGYVAVTTDQVSKANGRRDIYVAWRGTVRPIELEVDLHTKLVPATPLMSGSRRNDNYHGGHKEDAAKVMEGWLTIYTSSNPDSPFPKTSAQTQVLSAITKLMEVYKHENVSLIFTGHSLGGVLAALSAFNVVETGVVADHVRVGAFVFGCPKLGNKVFCDKLKALQNLRILHVRNVLDLVPNFPVTVPGYEPYAGIELQINSNDSPFLKASLSPWDWHNLQGMLHVVAGWNGKGGKFELKVKRSLALVNKSSNFLKDKYQVPESWWVEKNKGMVLDKDGEWVEAKPFQED